MVYDYCLCFHDTSICKHKEENMDVISTLSGPQVFGLLNKCICSKDCKNFNCSSDKFGALRIWKVMLLLQSFFTECSLSYFTDWIISTERNHTMEWHIKVIVRSPALVWLPFFNLSLIALIFFLPLVTQSLAAVDGLRVENLKGIMVYWMKEWMFNSH